MGRCILFRGRILESRQWIAGNLIVSCDKCFIMAQKSDAILKHSGAVGIWFINAECAEVDPATVGQYTGIDDIDVCKLFEGDIVEFERFTGGFAKAMAEQWTCK